MTATRLTSGRALLLGGVVATVVHGLAAYGIAGSTHPWGAPFLAVVAAPVAVLTTLAALVTAVVSLALVATGRLRRVAGPVTTLSLTLGVGGVAVLSLGFAVRERGLVEFTTGAGNAVVMAIESYADDHGHAPPSLQDLVPDYLPTRPTPSVVPDGGTYEYATAQRARLALNDGAWMLSVPLTPISIGRWEELIYVSEADYELRLVGGDVERRGRWLHLRGE